MIKVINPGFYSSIQDLGRFGFQDYGVPYAGVMDQFSAELANHILGNEINQAVLEITMAGPELQFLKPTFVCVTGACLSPKINNKAFQMHKIIPVQQGDILSFGRLVNGFRSYLAVSNGFQTEVIMRSHSMYRGITQQERILKGDTLEIGEVTKDLGLKHAHVKLQTSHLLRKTMEVFKGPEFEKLPKQLQEVLRTKEFTISKENSRMAYQLEEVLPNNLEPIITAPVLPGTVQLTLSGKLIILMRDCQTTGGYPRVFQLKESAINMLSQKYTGHKIRFKILSSEF